MTKKVGIIGFGKMGLLHGGLFNQHPSTKLYSVMDKSKFMMSASKSVMKRVNFYKDSTELIKDSQVDIIAITTPTFAHIPIAIEAIENNKHLFIEKPLAISVKEANMLLEASKEKSKVVYVAYVLRHNPMFVKAKEMIDNGEIGNVKNVLAEMYIGDVLKVEKGWRYNPKLSGGGVLIDFGIHMVDLLHWYFGNCTVENAKSTQKYSIEVEDEVEAKLNFQNNVSVDFKTTWSSETHRKSYSKMTITGECGTVHVSDQTITVLNKSGEVILKLTQPEVNGNCFYDIGGSQFSHQIEYFNSMVEKGEQNLTSLMSSIYVQEIVEEIYRVSKG